MHTIDESDWKSKRVRYTLSDNPDFDIARLKSIHDVRYVRILDKKTGRCKALLPQEYVNLFSENLDKLRDIIDRILGKNAYIMEADIVAQLQKSVSEALDNLLDDLKIVNYKGERSDLPRDGMRIGDVYKVDGKYYVFIGFLKNGQPEYKRVLFEGEELSDYYTKTEFDDLYANSMGLISSWLRHNVEEYSEDFYNRFMPRAELEQWISMATSSIQAYTESIQKLAAWRDEKAASMDQFVSSYYELSSLLEQVRSDISQSVADWKDEKQREYDTYVGSMNAKYAQLRAEVDGFASRLGKVDFNVGVLSSLFEQILAGKQEILEVDYEA